MTAAGRNRILLIEDNPGDARLIQEMLKEPGGSELAVVCAPSLTQARQVLRDGRFDAVLLDLNLPESRGLGTVAEAQRLTDLPIVVLTGLADEALGVEALKAGAQDYLVKERTGAEVIARAVRYAIERKRGADALRRERDDLQAVFEAMVDGVYIVGAEYDIEYGNPVLLREFGPHEGRKCYGWLHGRDDPCPWCRNEEVLAGATVRWEWASPRNGRVYDLVATPLHSPDGTLRRLEIFRDITERKRAEEQRDRQHRDLAERVKELRCLYGVSNVVAEGVGPIDEILKAAVDLIPSAMQYPEVACARVTFAGRQFESPGFAETQWSLAAEIVASGETVGTVEVRYLEEGPLTGGEPFQREERDLIDAIARMVGQAIARDSAKRLLSESERRFREFFENAPAYCYMIAPDGVILDVNRAALQGLGYRKEELLGRHVETVYAPDARQRVKSALLAWRQRGRLEDEEMVALTKDGGRRTVLLSASAVCADDGTVLHSISIQRDVTEQQALEEQFRHSQKMEAIGLLAGGVAHDFNNLLTGITGYSAMLLDTVGGDSPMAADLHLIHDLGMRAADLTRQLLAFSRRQTLQPIVLDLNSLVEGVTKMLKRLVGEDIDLAFAPAPDLGRTQADAGRIEQVLMNLAVNARDAMPAGGMLAIETANVTLDEAYAAEHVGAKAGEYVMLAVTDTGCGMDARIRQRIFEPFFTTKGLGRGTGLGLSTVYGIVKQHGGNIWVYSEPGKGTTFKVYLPRVSAEAQELRPKAQPDVVPQGRETILLVEDDGGVRDVSARVLADCGYTVLEAPTPVQAQAVFAEHADEIVLLLTDVVLPGCSGPKLAEALRAARPLLKVLYMSGYTDDAVVRNGSLAPGAPFMEKPFSPQVLARRVREVLDG